jgi:hypothetical protein
MSKDRGTGLHDGADQQLDSLAKAVVERPQSRRGILKLGAGVLAMATAGAVPQWAFGRTKNEHFVECGPTCHHDVCGHHSPILCGYSTSWLGWHCECLESVTTFTQHGHCQCFNVDRVSEGKFRGAFVCPSKGNVTLCDSHNNSHCPPGYACLTGSCCGFSYCAPLCSRTA